MALTRTATDPLTSDDPTLRAAALAQFSLTPTLDAARALVRALLHFLQDQPAIAEQFSAALYRPPLAKVAEEPVLELLDHKEAAVREQGAFILYKIRARASSRARLQKALSSDDSYWVRCYAAKALASLGGAETAALLAEAIDNEATLEAISRMGEALALCGRAEQAGVLVDQAEQLRDRSAPADRAGDKAYTATVLALALYLDALAALLDPGEPDGKLEPRGEGRWHFSAPRWGELDLAGGPAEGGYVARVRLQGYPEVRLPQDSPEALARLGS